MLALDVTKRVVTELMLIIETIDILAVMGLTCLEHNKLFSHFFCLV